MASYHLDVKSVQRSAGRSATAAIAYRAADRISTGLAALRAAAQRQGIGREAERGSVEEQLASFRGRGPGR